jgi:NAD(P)H-flavin reductase/hemoglobin-like flavoprotein
VARLDQGCGEEVEGIGMDWSEHEDLPVPLPAGDDAALLEENLRLIEDRSDRVLNYFYASLFLESPALRSLFPAAMDAQRDRLFRALLDAVRNIADAETVVPMLAQLGRDHRKYGVRTEDYAAFGRALITTLERYSEDVWVPELEEAWVRAYAFIANTMIAGATDAAAGEPAWWRAEIVGHERRADDIAVITVRPDRAYAYRAGQYTSIETPYRPRSWRNYSMATAESPDGTIEFHVRSIGAGFVSGPLVWRAALGDVLKLGAPMGDMAIDKQSQRDVLCIAGGTGLAPIKAMIDEMTRWNTARTVTVYFGVREADDLYDMPALHRIEALNRWLTVVPCVSDDPDFVGERGTLADVVARHGSWSEHDVYVCGSPDMTRATLSRLRDIGVPERRISFDVAEDLHPAAAQVIDLRRTRAKRATQSLPRARS